MVCSWGFSRGGFYLLLLTILHFSLSTNGISNSGTPSSLNDSLLKTKGWLKFPENFSISNLLVDFKLHARSRIITYQTNHNQLPLFRGRAVLSYDSKQKKNTRLRLVSTSSLLKKSIYYDSEKLAFTQHFHNESEEDIITSTQSFQFHNFFTALHDEMMSNIAYSHFIPESVPIFDEAVDRLCPSSLLSRHVVYFEDQHYIFCVLKKDPHTITVEKMVSNLLHLRYIIGQEFTIQITSVEQLTNQNVKMRGGNNYVNQTNVEPTFEQLFATSKTIQEELSLVNKEQQVSNSRVLKDLFPKEKARAVISLKSYISPAKAYFFNSVACKVPYLRNNDKCQQQVEQSEEKKICLFVHGCGELEERKGM